MKSAVRIIIGVVIATLAMTELFAQKIDADRMDRDIEVAENILGTLIRQKYEKKLFFPLEVEGAYTSGYGVIFRLPGDYFGPLVFSTSDREGNIMMLDAGPGAYSFDFSVPEIAFNFNENHNEDVIEFEDKIIAKEKEAKEREKEANELSGKAEEMERKAREMERSSRSYSNRIQLSNMSSDSLRQIYKDKIVEASKTFLADYGDLIGQLGTEEKIMITNRNDRGRQVWGGNMKNSYLSVEVSKGDIQQYRSGKLSREQFMGKIKVVNTESTTETEPDLELMSSIFNRLYRTDLSKTYFTNDRIYYERLKDFGVIYYMKVYSSNYLKEPGHHSMPTVGLLDVNQQERDKKVKELLPLFEEDIKQNILDYGRTVKSLKENEVLTFDIKLTKCEGCGIPTNLEVSIKASVLNDYNTGKITKEGALSKFMVKRGENQ
ncbi:MAG: hypothetical protein HC811_12275 [Flammeovirgaceae bacterium]|nr:hypothetical protein [Flammeovirgaceae bacterium]